MGIKTTFDFKELTRIQELRFRSMIEEELDREERQRPIYDEYAERNRIVKEVWECGNIQIAKIKMADGEINYATFIDFKSLGYLAYTFDEALLIALGRKYDGLNSQFAMFASKMLGMKPSKPEYEEPIGAKKKLETKPMEDK